MSTFVHITYVFLTVPTLGTRSTGRFTVYGCPNQQTDNTQNNGSCTRKPINMFHFILYLSLEIKLKI